MPAASGPPPPPIEEVRAALKAVRWLDVRNFVKRIAMFVWHFEDDENLEDFIQEAITAVLDGAETGNGRVWNPRKVTLPSYLVGVMRSIRSNTATDAQHRREVIYDPTRTEHPNPVHNPEHNLRIGAKHVRGLERRERALAAMDPAARAIYEAVASGTFRLKLYAEEHGLSVPEVRAARARMKYALQKAIDADGIEPDSSGSRLAAPPARPVDTTNEDESGRNEP